MKFVCGKCNAKYSVTDDRVAGKVLKIRCKICGNIIEISARQTTPPRPEARIGAATGDPGLAGRFAESFSRKDKGPASGTPGLLQAVKHSAAKLEKDENQVAIWFVAVDDRPVGPATAASVWRFRTSGKVNDDSLVWKEGMPDWTPLRNCKELVGALAKLDLSRSAKGGDAGAKPRAAPPEPPRRGLFAAEAEGAAASPLRGQRLGRLDEDLAPPPPPPAATAPAVLDQVLSDIAPASAKAPEAESDFFGEEPDAMSVDSRLASLQQISLPRVTGQNRWITVAAVGFLGVAIAVLGVAVATSGNSEPRVITEVVEKVVEVEKEKIVYRDTPQVRTETEEVASESGKAGSSSKSKGSGSASAGGGNKDAETLDEKKKKLLEQMGLAAPSGDQKLVGDADKASEADKGSGSSVLTSEQIRKTYNKNRNSMQICYERSLKQGEVPEESSVKAETRMVVGRSGMVKSVTVGGQAAKYPGLKSCIEKAAKKWVFPASAGDSPVEIPTLFTPK